MFEDDLEPTCNDNVFNDQIPLIPTEFSNVYEALQNFNAVFEARYGATYPSFFPGSLKEAIVEAFEAPCRSIMERRPLVIYLHNDSSIASNIFAQNVLCSEEISSLLKYQFVVWAWDMSQAENRQKLYAWMEADMPDVAENVKNIHKSKYPLLIVLIKERGTIMPSAIAKGHDTVTQTLERLMTGLDHYLQIKNKDAADELSRLEREQIRQEQIEEYEKSLATDRAKQEEIQRKKQLEREQEAEQKRVEMEKLKRQELLASTLPPEPAESDKSAVMIRMRFPSGEQKVRRFHETDSLKWLVTFVESLGYDMENYRIKTSDVPKKDVATMDSSKSFVELSWPRREQVTVEEK